MSNQPPYDGSQDPVHDQPTERVPQVDGHGSGSDQGDNAWQPGPPYGPSPYSSAPQYGEQAPRYGQQPPQYGAAPQYGQSAPAAAHHPHNGYDATASKSPYGQQNGYGPSYSGPGYGGYEQPGYYVQPQASGSNTSAIVLTVVSGIGTLVFCGVGLPSLVMGIIALTKQPNDPAGAARLAKIGWIVFAVLAVLAVIAVIAFIAIGFAAGSTSHPSGYYSDPTF